MGSPDSSRFSVGRLKVPWRSNAHREGLLWIRGGWLDNGDLGEDSKYVPYSWQKLTSIWVNLIRTSTNDLNIDHGCCKVNFPQAALFTGILQYSVSFTQNRFEKAVVSVAKWSATDALFNIYVKGGQWGSSKQWAARFDQTECVIYGYSWFNEGWLSIMGVLTVWRRTWCPRMLQQEFEEQRWFMDVKCFNMASWEF